MDIFVLSRSHRSTTSPKGYASDMKDELSSSRLLPSEDSSWSETSERQPQPRTPWKWIIAFVSSILVTNVLTSMATIRLASRAHHPVSEPPNGAARFLKSVSKKTSAVLINTTFYDYDDSVYRKHSSKEADEAWHALTQGDNGVFLVPKEDAEQSGIDPKRHAYWDNPEAGLVGYPAGIEALHQVHCLNLLRQSLYFNIDFTREQCASPVCGVPEEYAEIHIDHCVDFLRHRLMCTADIGIVPMVWLGHNGRTTGDMARMHTCRDYESLRRFTIEKGHGLPREGVVKPKPGDFVVHDYI